MKPNKQELTARGYDWALELARYADDMRRRELSEHTIKNALCAINDFFSVAEPRSITRADVSDYTARCRDHGAKSSTVNVNLSRVGAFFAFLIDERGFDVENPVTRRARLKCPTRTDSAKEQLIFTKPEVAALMEAAKPEPALYHGIFVFLVSGMRISEYDGLMPESLQGRGILVENGKGKKTRFIDVSPAIMERIKETFPIWSTLRGQAFRLRFIEAAARAGIPREKAHPHNLRRYFITSLVNAGLSIDVAQNMAGHASMQTTRRYFNVAQSRMEEGANAVAAAVAGIV